MCVCVHVNVCACVCVCASVCMRDYLLRHAELWISETCSDYGTQATLRIGKEEKKSKVRKERKGKKGEKGKKRKERKERIGKDRKERKERKQREECYLMGVLETRSAIKSSISRLTRRRR